MNLWLFIRRLCALAVFFLAAAAPAWATPVNALVFSVQGRVEYMTPGSGSYAPLAKGQHLPYGTTIRTGDDGVVILVATPGAAVQLGSASILKLNELAFAKSGGRVLQRTANMTLSAGVISALIDPSTPQITDFSVQTPEGAAAARGTFYAVLVDHGKTFIGVREGKVAASLQNGR
jgi:hypothetical protein